MGDSLHRYPSPVLDNTREAMTHIALYGCSIAIHKPDETGRMWACTNPTCPIGPIGWITERRESL